MLDKVEAARRGNPQKARKVKHSYAAIEHRVIDSDAFKHLSFSAKTLLLLLARQLKQDNNGHLQASFSWCQQYGFGSEHTLKKAIAELIAHGLIYRTRSHGANGAWARYAVTWLPIKKREELFLDGFVSCAWRDWKPQDAKKSPRNKCRTNPAESAVSPHDFQQKVQEEVLQKVQSMNLIPCTSRNGSVFEGKYQHENTIGTQRRLLMGYSHPPQPVPSTIRLRYKAIQFPFSILSRESPRHWLLKGVANG